MCACVCKSDEETKNFFSFMMRHAKEILGDSSLHLSLSAAKEAKEEQKEKSKKEEEEEEEDKEEK